MYSSNKFHIIIIDDNPDIHQDFIKILTMPNNVSHSLKEVEDLLFEKEEKQAEMTLPIFEIDTATQGQEGVQKIKEALEKGNPYSLAFVDIRMPPGWDGVTTIENIWKIDPLIQVVICTAYSDYSWEETAKRLGVTDNLLILKKPFDNVAVRQITFALTKKWKLSKETRKNTEFLEQRVKDRTNNLEKVMSEMNTALETSSDGILVVDVAGELINYNHLVVEMFNIPPSIIEAKDYTLIKEHIINQLQNPSSFSAQLKDVRSNVMAISIEMLKLKSGKSYECFSQPYMLNKEIAGRVWSFRDITQRVLLEQKLEHQATHDVLTDLPNRVLLADRINQAIEEANRDHTIFAILFFDLDRFKLVNDSLSHQAGDELLQQVAEKLKSIIRKVDTFSRIGGDEFVIVFPHLDNEESILVIINKILVKLREPHFVFNKEINISASVGVCFYPRDGKTAGELLSSADLAMYRAKELGGDQFQFYSSGLSERTLKRLDMEAEMRHGITNNEFLVYYQPQFDTVSRKLVAVEALLRWNHPIRGILTPIDFIPLAEETGLIVPLGEWVFRVACKQNKRWQELGLPPIRIAVNVATAQFRQRNFSDKIKEILHESGLDPHFLEIEITENSIINNSLAVNAINSLKEFGVQIALDDFGTGTSSLGHLRTIPIDHLKIDRSFVNNININHSDEVLIQAIIALADNLNLSVIAEGVETLPQLDFLKQASCRDVQGYYLSKPLPQEEFEQFMKEYGTGSKLWGSSLNEK